MDTPVTKGETEAEAEPDTPTPEVTDTTTDRNIISPNVEIGIANTAYEEDIIEPEVAVEVEAEPDIEDGIVALEETVSESTELSAHQRACEVLKWEILMRDLEIKRLRGIVEDNVLKKKKKSSSSSSCFGLCGSKKRKNKVEKELRDGKKVPTIVFENE